MIGSFRPQINQIIQKGIKIYSKSGWIRWFIRRYRICVEKKCTLKTNYYIKKHWLKEFKLSFKLKKWLKIKAK